MDIWLQVVLEEQDGYKMEQMHTIAGQEVQREEKVE